MLPEIESRRSIRRYLNKPVEPEKLQELFESARLAPSGSNTQPWVFIAVTNQTLKEQLCVADHQQNWMLGAPVFIVCVADIRCRVAAEHLGLAACWTAWFEQKDVRPVLNIPPDKYVCGIITLGYADEAPKQRPRKPLETMLRYETW